MISQHQIQSMITYDCTLSNIFLLPKSWSWCHSHGCKWAASDGGQSEKQTTDLADDFIYWGLAPILPRWWSGSCGARELYLLMILQRSERQLSNLGLLTIHQGLVSAQLSGKSALGVWKAGKCWRHQGCSLIRLLYTGWTHSYRPLKLLNRIPGLHWYNVQDYTHTWLYTFFES